MRTGMMIEEGVEKCDDGDESGGRTLRDPLIPSTSPQTEGFIFEKLRGGFRRVGSWSSWL